MFGTPQNQIPGIDPNTQRALVELATVIGDVEQRIQLVKVGLAQVFPQIATLVQARGLGATQLPLGLGAQGFPLQGMPPSGFAPAYGPQVPVPFGVGVPQGLAPSPLGLNVPFGAPTGFGTPGSFRY